MMTLNDLGSQTVITIAIGLSVMTFLHLIVSALKKTKSEHVGTIKTLEFSIVPLLTALILVRLYFESSAPTFTERLIETCLGLALLWLVTSVLKAILFHSDREDSWKARVPKLLVDILRFGFVLAGALILIGGIWHKDITPFITTFGLSSIVIGLALQDTLGNLFSGLALVLERPFTVGDWLEVSGVSGKVQQINWRAVRLVTREFDEIVIPNSILTKEKIINYSRPKRVHGHKLIIGYSYDLAPNMVKANLLQCAHSTSGVLHEPSADVRVVNYGAYSVDYEVLLCIADYSDLTAIRNEFMTRVWYANKRAHLHIPYPTHTVYRADHVPPPSPSKELSPHTALRGLPIFQSLTDPEIEDLGRATQRRLYSRGEKIVDQGDKGSSMFVVLDGSASVQVKRPTGQYSSVARLEPGDFFGEMSLLTGEPRSARVLVEDDTTVAEISKEALAAILSSRPEVAEDIASVMRFRQEQLSSASNIREELELEPEKIAPQRDLVFRIKKFLGL